MEPVRGKSDMETAYTKIPSQSIKVPVLWKKTHRELPDSLIPYKRYGVEAFCEIAESTEARHTCETSTWLRIRSWLAWFICYAQNIATGLIAANLLPMTFHPGYTLRQQTVHLSGW